MSKITWYEYPKHKPKKEGLYLVYIDNSAENIPDTITTIDYFNDCWCDVNQDYCPVTHFATRPNPPKGTWMAKAKLKRSDE
jgi:hypothetical protein